MTFGGEEGCSELVFLENSGEVGAAKCMGLHRSNPLVVSYGAAAVVCFVVSANGYCSGRCVMAAVLMMLVWLCVD